VVDGDTLLLQVTQSDNEDGNINTIAGWANPVANAGSGGAPPSEPATSIFTRIASSEPASYVATVTNPAAVGMVARMLAFRAGDQGTILDVSITLATHNGVNTPNPPANTPVTRGCFAVAMWWHDDDLGVYGSVPAGYTDPGSLGSVVTAGGGNGASIGSAIKLLTGAVGVEDPGTFNVTDADEGGSATILLRPQFEEAEPDVPPVAGDVEVQDEGISLTPAVTKINFVGAGVTASEPVADEVDVTIPGSAGVFGTDFNNAVSLGQSTTTSATLQQKLRMSVNVAAGNYLLHYSFVLGQDQDEREVRARVQVDDTLTITDFTDRSADARSPYDAAMAGHRVIALDGAHDIDVDFSSPAAGTAQIRDTVLTIYRIS
jgi:hypothetical protein